MAKIPSTVSLAEKNKFQEKILTASVTTNGEVAQLTMNNLVLGKWYTINAQILLGANLGGASDNLVSLDIMHDGIRRGSARIDAAGGSPTFVFSNPTATFRATATTVTFELASASANAYLLGNNTKEYTYVSIEERNDLIETSEF